MRVPSLFIPLLAAVTTATAAGLTAFAAPPAATRDSRLAAIADTSAASRDSMMNAVLASIRGRGQLPAESVFKNITIFKGRPAAQVVRIMNGGFGRSLGVGCAHCHNVNQWDSDEKAPKEIARDMWALVTKLNTELLPSIKDLAPGRAERPVVNCTTCHRGDVKPALDLPPATPPR